MSTSNRVLIFLIILALAVFIFWILIVLSGLFAIKELLSMYNHV